MEKVNLGYSIKSIPVQTRKSSLLHKIEKVGMVIKRMKWNAILFSANEDNNNKAEWYGLKSLSSPRPERKNSLLSITN